ncbi:MAG: Mrp/NBP35 family ATP-binding protein [Micavibrio sp.]
MDSLEKKIVQALETLAAEQGESFTPLAGATVEVAPDGHALVIVEVPPSMGAAMEDLRAAAERRVRAIEGVAGADVILTAERGPEEAGAKRGRAAQADPHGMAKNPPLTLPFRHVIAVGSGKGGVGKSTCAFNLAASLAAMGYEVALLDADIYGPSIPVLTGAGGQKPPLNDSGKLVPLEAHGLKLMSMGFLVEEEKPMIWRGPMVQTAFYQMLRDVAWRNDAGLSDFLIIDMPPGTGDVQLTLAQKVPVTGAVIVSTPQDLALIDARKAIAMFEKTNIKVLGLIENMSMHICSHCGHEEHIFGHGGAREEASKRGVPFLGGVPLSARIREDSDRGKRPAEDSYANIARSLIENLG